MHADYLHIIFWSNNLPGSRDYPKVTGFILRVYVEMGDRNYTLLPQSRIHMFTGPTTFVHPSSNIRQDDNNLRSLRHNNSQLINKELSVVLFHPVMNNLGTYRSLSYRKPQTVPEMPCRMQSVRVFSFIVSHADGYGMWQFLYR